MYINPYERVSKGNGQWLRGNFHAHAGDPKYGCGIEEVVQRYRQAGYDVPCLTNHGGKPIVLLDDAELADYEAKHGIVLFNSYEYSSKGKHIVCVNVADVEENNEAHQAAINRCNRQGGFAVIAHPNECPQQDCQQTYWIRREILELRGYTGIEIVNGYYLGDVGGIGVLATDVWDHLLSEGKRVWGFANDDFHKWHHMAQAWNMIYTRSRTKGDIQAAVQQGSFYCSTGLTIAEIGFADNTLRVAAKPKDTLAGKKPLYLCWRQRHGLGQATGGVWRIPHARR